MGYAYLSIALASTFLAILVVLHFLKRELDPSWRMISEYEIGRYGWLMRLAFFCWGASVLALTVAIQSSLQRTSGAVGHWWFVVIAMAMFGAGIFKTNAITDRTPSLVNTLHTLCGVIVILTFPVAATITAYSLLLNPAWSASQGSLIPATALTWVGVVTFFGSIIGARVKNPLAGEAGGPRVYQGWPNRFMVATYALWIVAVAVIATVQP
jgi:NAD/NADP transhydrogenase beta subunit